MRNYPPDRRLKSHGLTRAAYDQIRDRTRQAAAKQNEAHYLSHHLSYKLRYFRMWADGEDCDMAMCSDNDGICIHDVVIKRRKTPLPPVADSPINLALCSWVSIPGVWVLVDYEERLVAATYYFGERIQQARLYVEPFAIRSFDGAKPSDPCFTRPKPGVPEYTTWAEIAERQSQLLAGIPDRRGHMFTPCWEFGSKTGPICLDCPIEGPDDDMMEAREWIETEITQNKRRQDSGSVYGGVKC